jgi:hypothetical protein
MLSLLLGSLELKAKVLLMFYLVTMVSPASFHEHGSRLLISCL